MNVTPLTSQQLKVDALQEQASAMYESNPDSAILIAYQTQAMSEKIKYQWGIANAYAIISHAHREKNELAKALLMGLDASSILENLKDERAAQKHVRVLLNIGAILRMFEKFQEAATFYDRGIEMARVENFPQLELELMYNKGLALRREGNRNQALKVLAETMSLAENLNDEPVLINCFNLIGLTHKDNKSYEEARKYYQRILAHDLATRENKAYANHNTAVSYYQQEKLDEAIEFYEEALIVERELDQPEILFRTLHDLSISYLDKSQIEAAEKHALEAEQLYEQLLNAPETFKIYHVLNLIYKEKNDPDQTEYYEKRYQEMLKSFHSHKESTFNKDQFEIDQILVRYKEEQEIEEQNARYDQLILWLSVTVLLAIIISLIIYFRQQAVKRKISTIFKDHLND